jgi:hypothetical protein
MAIRVNWLVVALLTSGILISPVKAQMRGAGVGLAAPPGVGSFSPPRGIVSVFRHPVREHPFGSGRISWPYFYSPYLYSDDNYEPAATRQTVPQVIVSQAPPLPQVSTPEPLLIEWQGDHWERISSSQSSPRASGPPKESNSRSGVAARNQTAITPRELPPAILVFRDGRKEEVSSYTIMGSVMYTNANYWTDGSWTKKIQLADLDVPATLKLNQERGVKFTLPSGPYEIVIRQ